MARAPEPTFPRPTMPILTASTLLYDNRAPVLSSVADTAISYG
jgi:hypothetical protein